MELCALRETKRGQPICGKQSEVEASMVKRDDSLAYTLNASEGVYLAPGMASGVVGRSDTHSSAL